MTSIKVAVRVRPLNRREEGSKFIIQMQNKKTTITNFKIAEGNADGESSRESLRTKDFTFDYSFWTVDPQDTARYHSQEVVYQSLGKAVVQSGYEGYNACVFAYGQTGSGKTYTMMGPPDDRGLIPRICQDLFNRMTDGAMRYRTEVSYLEIYNEKVRDLLKTTNSHKALHTLRVREHPKDGPYVQGLSKYIVSSYSEMEDLMMKGSSVRVTAATNMNDTSSRSHAIFTILFTQATIRDGIPSEKTSKIHLVDLAGSERATATGATGQRLREGASINKSLVSLGTVIKQLADMTDKGGRSGKGLFIPYRDSTLTWLLKDSLGGNSRTVMVTTISPANVNYAETLSALRYANRAKNIINRPTVNEDPNVKIIRDLRLEIDRLKTMIGGNNDNITSPKVKERLHESEARMKVLTEMWTEKWKDVANILQEQSTLALRKEGLGVVLDSALPHLIGIDDDILSTGIMLYHLKEGHTRIGRSDAEPSMDIVIAGMEVEMEHCVIDNTNSTVTLTPMPDAICSINGNPILEATKLTQGAVILLGRTSMFRFNNPVEAAQMKKDMEKSGITTSLSRSSLLSQSMSDLYRSSDNINNSGWELDVSHREELEKIEELKQELKVMEDRYHGAEDQRINRQVAMEMELEKKQSHLTQAVQQLEQLQQTLVHEHHRRDSGIMMKLPKGAEIHEMLQKLLEKENTIIEMTQSTRHSLLEEMERLRAVNEESKEANMSRVSRLDDAIQRKDRRLDALEEEVRARNEAAKTQDDEDEKVIDFEYQQLEKMQRDFDILFHSKLGENESLKDEWYELEIENKHVTDKFDRTESSMKERWKREVDGIAVENSAIEDAWNDLKQQEQIYDDQLLSATLSEVEKHEIEMQKDYLKEARTLLRLEEHKVASRERRVLDSIEQEMDKWEHEKSSEQAVLKDKLHQLAIACHCDDLDQLGVKISEKESTISEFQSELKKQNDQLTEFEKTVEIQREAIMEEKDCLEGEKCEIAELQCGALIELETEIIRLNEEINGMDTSMTEELTEIQEERERLTLLLNGPTMTEPAQNGDSMETLLESLKLSEEQQRLMGEKKKELEHLQASVDNASEKLDEKIRKFDAERDYELDTIEFEKDRIEDRVKQDRINVLVEQEVKRRLYEEKVQREHKRAAERDQDRRDREDEIKRLKEAHHRELSQLREEYEKRCDTLRKTLTPSNTNHVSSTSADSDSDIGRSQRVGSFTSAAVQISVPRYYLSTYNSDTRHEYEVKIAVGDENYTISRRYSRIRELHMQLKRKFPQVAALVFPPKRWFSRRDKVAVERRVQLEFYLRSMMEICCKIPSCPLHPSQNRTLTKDVLWQFDSFFKKGLFESINHNVP